MQYAYLENTTGNSHKFYEMIEKPGGMFTAKYGRIGNTPQETSYNMNVWFNKYNEKIKKGYVDKTSSKNPPKPKKPPFVVNVEHLDRIDKVMLILTSHSSMIENSAELIRDVSAVRKMLKDPTSQGKGKLDADDMLYLNVVWKKIKRFANKNK